jgi:O-antigen/teichoic acid export membrane protein
MGAFSLTLANSFGLQGVVLTIGWAISPTAAAIFATTRMLTRIPMQFSNLLTRASLPELTRAQVSGNATLTQKLMKINFGLTLAVMLPAALILSWLGPDILHYMSNGEMSQTHLNFALLGLAASLCAIWTTLGTRLISVNRQSEFSYLALALYALSALMPFAVGKAMTPILVALVVADGLIAFKTWRIK